MQTQLSSATLNLATAVEECDWNDSASVVNLITNRYTPLLFDDQVRVKQWTDPDSMSRYFDSLFPVEQFPDGHGQTLHREIYHPAYVPSGFQFFNYSNVSCDPTGNDKSQCIFCYESIPHGGTSTMQAEWMERNLRTEPYCVNNIRNARDFQAYVQRILDDRMVAEEVVKSDFFTMVALRTAWNKILLENDYPNALLIAEPRRLLTQYPMSYANDFFPQVFNPNNIQYLTLGLLDQLAARMQKDSNFKQAMIARGERGEPIYQMWVDDDWYWQNIDINPAWSENIRFLDPKKLFSGYNANMGMDGTSAREYIRNWSFKTAIRLPRFGVNSVTGGLTIIQPRINVPVQVGNESIINPDWENATFGLGLIVSPTQANVLGRTNITTSQGITIPNIEGDGTWYPWNKYDAQCNPEENLPEWRWRYRKGFIPNQPWSGIAILYRRKKVTALQIQTCDLADIIEVTPETGCVDVALNGTCSGRAPVEADITSTNTGSTIQCSAALCGSENVVRVTIKGLNSYSLVGCDCGSTVLLSLSDDSTITGTILSNAQSTALFPYNEYIIDLGVGTIDFDEVCVTNLQCQDGTPATATILACVGDDDDLDPDQVYLFLSEPLTCDGSPVYTITPTVGAPFVIDSLTVVDLAQNKYLAEDAGLTCTNLTGGTIVCT